MVAACCHALRGSAAAITADRLAKSCAEIEELMQCGDVDQARERFEVLQRDWSRLCAAINAFQAGIGA